ncbi:helix-turn-helix domain-containing protein [Roseomonas mucosa]|uniref:helix-turn-helix domain-containing protein n=1 Tax=Roseomonas mucosa TaxID=207340 RepID=UPI00385101B3
MDGLVTANLSVRNRKAVISHSQACTLLDQPFGILRPMASELQPAIARRIRAVMAELDMSRRDLAKALGVGENSLGNWLSDGKKASKPAEEAMIRLCEMLPGLTMDYLYRGKLDFVPMALAIRLKGWEQGEVPDRHPSPQKALSEPA